MPYKIIINSFVENYFSTKEEQIKLNTFLQEKLPVYVASHSPKIKPVGKTENLYELKVRMGKNFYRLAYALENDTIFPVYLTKTLQKVVFDKEVKKFLSKEGEK